LAQSELSSLCCPIQRSEGTTFVLRIGTRSCLMHTPHRRD